MSHVLILVEITVPPPTNITEFMFIGLSSNCNCPDVFSLLGSSIIVWKQPDRIISAGMGMIRKDKRMKLLEHSDGVNLQITNLDIDDAGNYICEVENEGEPILQTNQLQILGN